MFTLNREHLNKFLNLQPANLQKSEDSNPELVNLLPVQPPPQPEPCQPPANKIIHQVTFYVEGFIPDVYNVIGIQENY